MGSMAPSLPASLPDTEGGGEVGEESPRAAAGAVVGT